MWNRHRSRLKIHSRAEVGHPERYYVKVFTLFIVDEHSLHRYYALIFVDVELPKRALLLLVFVKPHDRYSIEL